MPELERVYTDIHAHPELSMQETRAAGLVADRLRLAGYDVTDGIGKTGVVGLLRNGDGPTVMLRADMDAFAGPGTDGAAIRQRRDRNRLRQTEFASFRPRTALYA